MQDRHGLTAQQPMQRLFRPNFDQPSCNIWCYIYYLAAVGLVITDHGSLLGGAVT